jgi:hypothetical protein
VRGTNASAKDAIDEVSIIEQGDDGKGYATSVMLKSLGDGRSFTLGNWRKTGKNMVITGKKIETGSDPWYITVEFNFDNADSDTPSPSTKTTPAPTPEPTPQSVRYVYAAI